MLKKICILILFLLISVGCVNSNNSTYSIDFITDHSIANLVEVEDRLLSIAFVVENNLDKAVGPFTIEIIASNEDLDVLLEQPFVNMGAQYTLQPGEKHRYGGTAIVKKEISADQLRLAIESKNSLEVQLLDESGELIASEWIHTFNIVQ